MTEFLTPLLDSVIQPETTLARVGIAVAILILGHLLVKTIDLSLKKTLVQGKELSKKKIENRSTKVKYLSYTLDAAVIAAAIAYLNAEITIELYDELIELSPDIVSVALILLLGIIVVNLLTRIGEDILKTVGIQNYLNELGLSTSSVRILSTLLKGFLYLVLVQIVLTQIGLGDTFISELVTASSWAAALLIAAIIFWTTKDLMRDYGAGVYLNNSRIVRPGEEVELEDNRGRIKEIKPLSTMIETDQGYTMMTPNSKILESNIKFKRTQNDIETLEEIKEYFVPQDTENTAPATIEMTLDILGYRNTQQEIQETMEETNPEEIQNAIEKLTNKEVRTAFVETEKISNIEDELKTWFNDGSLVILKIDKSEIFTDQEKENYILAIGVEKDEVLVLDPDTDSGGVYYINRERLETALQTTTEPRGYIIVAPKGTTAQWRIKNDLIYSDKSYYEELSKTLENRLTKITRQGRILKNAMPEQVQNYTEKWRSTEHNVSRIWKPEEKQ